MTKSAKKAVPEHASESKTLVGLKAKQTRDARTAKMVVAGLAMNAVTTVDFTKFVFDVDLTECLNALVDSAECVNAGDLGEAEALLAAQAVSLNAIFVQLARRSNVSEHVDHLDRYMRLATALYHAEAFVLLPKSAPSRIIQVNTSRHRRTRRFDRFHFG